MRLYGLIDNSLPSYVRVNDRGGLIASRNIDAATTALLKIGIGEKLGEQVNVDELIKQISGNKLVSGESLWEVLSTHPYVAKRIQKLIAYSEAKEYCELIGY